MRAGRQIDLAVCFNESYQGKEVVRTLTDRILGTLEVSGR
jgi:hypothetical protein